MGRAPAARDDRACERLVELEGASFFAMGHKDGGRAACMAWLRRLAGEMLDAHDCQVKCMETAASSAAHLACSRRCPAPPPQPAVTRIAPLDPGPSDPLSAGPDPTVARNRWRFKVCYSEALDRDPAAGGEIRIKLTLEPGGRGYASATVASTTADAPLTECIRFAFTRMKFPEPDGARAELTVPVGLSVNGPAEPAPSVSPATP